MAACNKFNCFVEDLLKGIHDFDNYDFYAALSNSEPDSAADTALSDITEISAAGGYSAGG